MLTIVAKLEGRVLPALRVPVLTPRLSAGWLKLITRVDYDLARELVLGLREDLLPRDRRYWQLTGHFPTWSFEAAAQQALETEKAQPGARGWFARREEGLVRRILTSSRDGRTP